MTPEKAKQYLLYKQPSDFYPEADRMERLMHALGDPQKRLRFVHIAGTNGKGSTACLTASVLKSAGFKTGLFTSPHLVDFGERIRINDEFIPDDDDARLASLIKTVTERENIQTAAFDRMTAAAFMWFFEQECDIVVLEVGLGGALDATNVIDSSEVSVITSIGLDHTAILGDTIEEIAGEKSGIIKQNGHAVFFKQGDGADDVIAKACERQNAVLSVAQNNFVVLSRDEGTTLLHHPALGEVKLGLPGEYQLKNASTALEALLVLRRNGWEISDNDIRCGFESARWPARFEALVREPLIILDGGHNPQCAEGLVNNLKTAYPDRKFTFLIGMLADKDVNTVLSILTPVAKGAVAVTVDDKRALKAEELCELLNSVGIPSVFCESYEEAVKKAVETANGAGVCAFGSLYFTGDVRNAVDKMYGE